MDIKYIKELGTGFSGTVYLVKIKNKLCSLKIQHIFKKDILNKKSDIWNEITFYKYVSDFYPIFKKFYSYNIVSDCKFIKNNNSIGLSVSGFPMYEKLQKSNYCIEYISSYEENTLGTIIDKLNIKQLYSLILQILCGIKILQDKKYTQNDLNIMNITYNKTTKKYTTIKSKNITYKIPVFDYIYTIIDYGGVEHPSFIHNKEERQIYLKNYKKIDICNLIGNIKKYWFSSDKKKTTNVDKLKNEISYMELNSKKVEKLITYFQNKLI